MFLLIQGDKTYAGITLGVALIECNRLMGETEGVFQRVLRFVRPGEQPFEIKGLRNCGQCPAVARVK